MSGQALRGEVGRRILVYHEAVQDLKPWRHVLAMSSHQSQSDHNGLARTM